MPEYVPNDPLVLCQASIVGYNLRSLIRASAVVKRQSAATPAPFRSRSHAVTWRSSAGLSPTRSGRPRASALNSISAMFSHEPCLGVWRISSRSARRFARSGGKPSYRLARGWGVELVHHQHELLRLGVAPLERRRDEPRPVAPLAALGDGHVPPARERLEGPGQAGGARAHRTAGAPCPSP